MIWSSRTDSRSIYGSKGGRQIQSVSRISRAWITGHPLPVIDVAMLFECFFVLCLVAGSQQFTITEFIVPHSVEAKTDAELHCRYSLNETESDKGLFVKWWWTPSNSEDRKQLYQRIAGYNPDITQHKINTEIKANDTLVLLAVESNASGIYECEVSNIDEVRRHQELIVYTNGTGPQLNVSTIPDGPDEDDEEDVLIKCEAEDVAPLPDLTLSINGAESNITVEVTGPDDHGLYSVFGNATVSKNSVDGANIRCELFYENTNVTHPEFVVRLLYDPTGALTSTATPEDTTELDATVESNLPGDGMQLRGSFALLLTISILTYLTGLSCLFM